MHDIPITYLPKPGRQLKEAEVTRTAPSESHLDGNIRQGFVYERVPHITLKSIANNAEIDVIWEKYQETLEPMREQLNKALNKKWEEWEIPRDAEDEMAGRSQEAPCRMVADTNRPPKGDRRIHCRQGRI